MSTSFEKHARDQFEQHKVSVDVEALWDQVYPQVKEEKKDRKFLWFFLSGFLVSVALFSAFYFLQNEETAREGSSAATLDSSASFEKQRDLATLSGKENSENSTVSNNAFTDADTDTKVALNNQRGIQMASQHTSTKTNIKPAKIGSSEIPEETISQTDLFYNNTIASPNNLEKVVQTNSPDVDSNKKPIELAIVDESSSSGLKSVSLYSLYPNLFQHSTIINYPELQEGTANKKGFRKDSPFHGMRFGIGAYAGIGKTTSEISSDKDDAAQTYQSLRKNSEEQLETLHFGLSAILETKQNIYIRSGVEYTRIASLFSKETKRVTVDSIPGIVEIRINEITNDTIEIEGFQEITTTESYRKKTFNYFHLIDIPVILGYNFKYDNWQIGLEAGIMANVYLQRKGNIFAADETFYDLKEDESDWHKTNIGITPFAGINAAYNISDRFQIHVSPGFRFKKAFSTSDYPGKVELASLSLRTGVRVFF